jgi:hypothetical protein
MATAKPGNVSICRRAALGALLAAAFLLAGSAASWAADSQDYKIGMPEAVSSFLKQALPKNYSFYALESR